MELPARVECKTWDVFAWGKVQGGKTWEVLRVKFLQGAKDSAAAHTEPSCQMDDLWSGYRGTSYLSLLVCTGWLHHLRHLCNIGCLTHWFCGVPTDYSTYMLVMKEEVRKGSVTALCCDKSRFPVLETGWTSMLWVLFAYCASRLCNKSHEDLFKL